jgi:hypothetical protein
VDGSPTELHPKAVVDSAIATVKTMRTLLGLTLPRLGIRQPFDGRVEMNRSSQFAVGATRFDVPVEASREKRQSLRDRAACLFSEGTSLQQLSSSCSSQHE